MTGTERADDALLVVAVQRHHEEALAEFYRRHGGSVFHIALRVLVVRGLAEEVVQNIFIRLWQSPDRFDPARGRFAARSCWLRPQPGHRHRRSRPQGDAGKGRC